MPAVDQPTADQRTAAPPPTTEQVRAALRDVADPEWPVSIVDMGLVYDVAIHGRTVAITLTFTSTACPCMDMIRDDIRDRLRRLPGVEDVTFRLSWDPPWTKDRLSEKAREQFKQWGVTV